VCTELTLWEARSMYQVMRGPCTGSQADNTNTLHGSHLKQLTVSRHCMET
jgi:hypothetical protein